jgi:hypothetical protein
MTAARTGLLLLSGSTLIFCFHLVLFWQILMADRIVLCCCYVCCSTATNQKLFASSFFYFPIDSIGTAGTISHETDHKI